MVNSTISVGPHVLVASPLVMPPFTLAGVSGPNVNPSSACEEAILKLNNMGILQNGGVAMRFVGAGRYVWAVLTLARRIH